MKEESFRLQVREIARYYAWDMMYHTHDSRRSDAGFPDEVIANRQRERILFVEFKSDKGRMRPAQIEWLEMLCLMGIEVAIWRPKDMGDIKRVLGPENMSLYHPRWDLPRKKITAAVAKGWEFPERLTRTTP